MLKRNIACLTFLVNEEHKSINSIVSEKVDLDEFVFMDYFSLTDIGCQLTEFLIGHSIIEHNLIRCSYKDAETAVELWSELSGFNIKFYKEDQLVKTVRADEFIKNFSDMKEFHIYLSDFLRTEHYWVNGYTPKEVEPEQRDKVVVELLEKRLTAMEEQMQRQEMEIEWLKNKMTNQKEIILQLISLMERLNSRRSG